MARPVFTTSDLFRKSGDIIAEAMSQPVTITPRSSTSTRSASHFIFAIKNQWAG